MKIIVTGQCSLHWGRMEFGNIGNFYIMEPFFRMLHDQFPKASISTTFQMSDEFCERERVKRLPMEMYYGWDKDLVKAQEELKIAESLIQGNLDVKTTPYIEMIRLTDLVIDFSGDIWGDNADLLGDDRFMVGLLKNRTAQLLAKRTAMIAGSPGPFSEGKNLDFTREVYKGFDLVTNRESISIDLLKDYGFDISKTHSLACPAFCFNPGTIDSINGDHVIDQVLSTSRPSIGFLICGWNFTVGPFDKWPRLDEEYSVFIDAIERFLAYTDANIVLMSHSNGFPIPPKQFKLTHGRDYPIIKQLQRIFNQRGAASNIYALDGVYDAWQSKAILGQFDMVVSGRVHAAVGAMSQCVPTVIIDYGHEPKAHKLTGFAQVAGQEAYMAKPDQVNDVLQKMNLVWENRTSIKMSLESQIPIVKANGKKNFELLKALFE